LKDDEMVNDADVAEEMGFEKLCASGNCNSMPSKQKMQVKVHYDTSFNADTSDVNSYLDQMFTHVQSHFCQISLGTQVHIEVLGSYTYHADQTWTATGDILGGSVKDIAAADNSGADVQVFMCKDSSFYGTVGIAWVGTMCKTYYSGYNANLNEKRQNVLSSSSVVAHEMGHNMGMLHDFDDVHGGSNGPCDGTGIMSYGSAPNVWSTCSRNDFLALYNEIVSSSSLYWCLDDYPSACGGTPPGPTTAPPPTTAAPPPTGCGSPQWATDQWCDDENNNADCNWDGGACCNNDFGGWDTYCSACQCLEPSTTTTAAPTTTTTTTAAPTTTGTPSGCGSPQWAEDQWCDDENNNADCNWDGGACCNNAFGGWDTYCSDCQCLDPNVEATTTTEAPCVDIHPTWKCEKRKNKGKCSKNWVKKKCAKTCEEC